ncbi:MAG TPA: CBS domain-containing protein [Candidatus Deferrimicrobium sp.]|nr:CBS domain-containing protein [Candidatus Deferrimicrobium sp.]
MAIRDITAKDIMIKDVLTISPTEKVAAADLLMVRNNVGGLPVIENEKLVGIITQKDIMLSRFSISVGGLQVEDLMTRNPVTIEPETSLEKTLEIMLTKKVERLPVIKDGKLVGLVMHGQILKKIYEII